MIPVRNVLGFVRFLFILLVKIYIEFGMDDIVQQSQQSFGFLVYFIVLGKFIDAIIVILVQSQNLTYTEPFFIRLVNK